MQHGVQGFFLRAGGVGYLGRSTSNKHALLRPTAHVRSVRKRVCEGMNVKAAGVATRGSSFAAACCCWWQEE